MPNASSRLDVALLLVRVVVGLTFFLHGLDKLTDLHGYKRYFASLDIPLPGVMAPFVAVLETGGGIALALGLLTPLIGLTLAGNMLVAGLTEHTGDGFFVERGGYELVLLLGVTCLALVVAGAGRLSLDARFELERRLSGLVGGSRSPHEAKPAGTPRMSSDREGPRREARQG